MMDKEILKRIIIEITKIVETQKSLSNFELLEICKREGIGNFTNEQDNHLSHELVETAVNIHITQTYQMSLLKKNEGNSKILAELKDLENKMPTQSWRSREQIQFQQFSTPPSIGFLMTKILNPSSSELILEPSAGTGSLAAWLKVSGCDIYLNELSERRRALLEFQSYKPTGYDAEFIDDLLPDEILPDGVMMNPPFSSSGGRTKNNDSAFGFRHIRSALSRLKAGGRLVALLGTESGTQSDKARRFLSEIASVNDLRAIIHLPKNTFCKYGTSIGTSIICVVKSETPSEANRNEKIKNVLEAECKTLDECLKYTDIFYR